MPKIVGIGGKMMTGKTSVARYLSILYGGEVISIAGSLKGVSLYRLGVLSFYPQKHNETRRNLQGYASVGREIDPEMWVQTIIPFIVNLGDDEFVFIPDIRYLNEIQFLTRIFGKDNCLFLYLLTPLVEREVPKDILEHESEKLSPTLFDAVIPEKDFEGKVVSCVSAIKTKWGIDPTPRKPKLYIGTNINFSSEFARVFYTLQELLEREGYEVCNPEEEFGASDWNEWVEVKSLDEASQLLVTEDLTSLNEVDGGVFYFTSPSIGGSMEVFALSLQGKPVIIGVPLTLFYHPWLRFFGKVVWEHDTTYFPILIMTTKKYIPPVGQILSKLQ